MVVWLSGRMGVCVYGLGLGLGERAHVCIGACVYVCTSACGCVYRCMGAWVYGLGFRVRLSVRVRNKVRVRRTGAWMYWCMCVCVYVCISVYKCVYGCMGV